MSAQPKVVRVSGFLKNYHWGKENGLKEFLADSTVQPHAELWFGNHASGPSKNLATNKPVDIHQPAPILVKILSIGQPLSIQVHPDKDFAQANYEKLGLADPNQKDEILIALEPVWAFAGVKPKSERILLLENLAIAAASDSLSDQIQAIFALSQTQLNEKISSLINLVRQGEDKVLIEVFDELIAHYPTDAGVLVASLLEFHQLLSGEAIFVPAGCPHEYIKGTAIEVMTNSDNVFRMGLTIKPLEIAHALAALKDVAVSKFAASTKYSPGGGFEVLDLSDTDVKLPTTQYRVVLALAGNVAARINEESMHLSAGEALLVTDHTSLDLTLNGRAIVADFVKDGRL